MIQMQFNSVSASEAGDYFQWKIIQVQFATDQAGYEELERVLGTMLFEDKLQHARLDA